MKDKIVIFIIGVLAGAVIATGAFYIFNKNNNSCPQMNGGTPPEMPSGENGQPPEMPNGNNSNGQPPQMPSNNTQNNN